MATNPPKGDNHRNGAVRDRSQVHNPHNDRWVKRDLDTGRARNGGQSGPEAAQRRKRHD